MTVPNPPDLTTVLDAVGKGEPGAAAMLIPLIYHELHSLARTRMAAESPAHTLQTTALVNEAYLRLLGDRHPAFENRAHFFGAAAEAMRRILVEHARARHRLKRGGGWARVSLEGVDVSGADEPSRVLSLDAAVEKLQTFDPRLAEIVKLRCFVGMSIAETAAALGLSSRTVNRDWLAAKAWLKGEIGSNSPTDQPCRTPDTDDA
jgi:RNA polymerase sigma factor (TIGR02999 family)